MVPNRIVKRVRTRLLVCLTLIASSVIVSTAGAAPAAAAVPGLQEISAQSAASSVNKAMSLTCPAGKRAVGLGAQILGGSGRVQITRLNASSLLGTMVVNATEIGPFDGNWSLRGSVMCANPLPGLQLVSSTTNSFGKHAEAIAHCPAGTVALGQGFSLSGNLTGGLAQIRIPRLEAVSLSGGGTGARVHAFETNTFASAWTLTAQAICAALTPAPVRVLQFREASSPNSVLASCPAGPGMLSGGFITDPVEDVVMTMVGILVSVQSGSLKITKAAAGAESVFPHVIHVFSTAVCATA